MKRNTLSKVVASTLAAAVSWVAGVSTVHAMTPPLPTVPDDVRAAVGDDDLVLAFRKGDLTGDGAQGLVVAVYRGARFQEEPRRGSRNACELVIFANDGVRWNETARSRDAIDCVTNPLMDSPKELAYAYDLEIAPRRVRWSNADIRKNHTFEFAYDQARAHWYVHSMSQEFPVERPDDPNAPLGSGHGEIVSPRDFPLTPMEDLDASRLWPLLIEHTRTER